MADRNITKKNRRQVVIMAVALPLLALFATYSLIYLAGRETLLQTTNRGEFVDPPLMARDLRLADRAGAPVDGSKSWWVWVAAKDCGGPCQAALEELAQLPGLLAEDAPRVQLALVITGSWQWAELGDSAVFQQFRSHREGLLADGLYIVDPVGNVVLHYGTGTDVQLLMEDLNKMLRVSRLG